METLMLAGTIVRDSELRRTGKGDQVLGFTVVVDQGKDQNGNRRDGHFYDAALWGKRAEALAPYLLKGGKVTITGRPTVRVHDGKAYLGVNVDQITLQGGSQRQDGGREYDSRDTGGAPAGGGYDSDTIPFAPQAL